MLVYRHREVLLSDRHDPASSRVRLVQKIARNVAMDGEDDVGVPLQPCCDEPGDPNGPRVRGAWGPLEVDSIDANWMLFCTATHGVVCKGTSRSSGRLELFSLRTVSIPRGLLPRGIQICPSELEVHISRLVVSQDIGITRQQIVSYSQPSSYWCSAWRCCQVGRLFQPWAHDDGCIRAGNNCRPPCHRPRRPLIEKSHIELSKDMAQ